MIFLFFVVGKLTENQIHKDNQADSIKKILEKKNLKNTEIRNMFKILNKW